MTPVELAERLDRMEAMADRLTVQVHAIESLMKDREVKRFMAQRAKELGVKL